MENHEDNQGAKSEETPVPEGSETGGKRPLFVTILAALYFIGGMLLVGLLIAMATSMNAAFGRLGIPPGYARFAIGFLGALGMSAGVGMFLGKRWGWWLGAFFLTYSIARNVSVVVALPALAEQFHPSAGRLAFQYGKLTGRIVVDVLLCCYFFTPKVEAFFAVSAMPRWKRAVYLALVTIGVVLAFTISRLIISL